MDAVILHAEGDEILAEGLSAKIAPAKTFNAALRADSGRTVGENLAVFVVWSAKAEADGLGRALTRVAVDAQDRCVVVRTDGAPLPPVTAAAHVITLGATSSEFAAALRCARARVAPQPVAANTMRTHVGGWAPGVSIGLAIYAGMFVAAGAWRSEEITEAVENGKAVPLASALHSFQVAVAETSTSTMQIALAPSTPSASFVAPQRVVVTAALDTSTLPIIAAPETDATPVVVVKEYTPAPIRLHPVDASYVAPEATAIVPLIPLDVAANDTF